MEQKPEENKEPDEAKIDQKPEENKKLDDAKIDQKPEENEKPDEAAGSSCKRGSPGVQACTEEKNFSPPETISLTSKADKELLAVIAKAESKEHLNIDVPEAVAEIQPDSASLHTEFSYDVDSLNAEDGTIAKPGETEGATTKKQKKKRKTKKSSVDETQHENEPVAKPIENVKAEEKSETKES